MKKITDGRTLEIENQYLKERSKIQNILICLPVSTHHVKKQACAHTPRLHKVRWNNSAFGGLNCALTETKIVLGQRLGAGVWRQSINLSRVEGQCADYRNAGVVSHPGSNNDHSKTVTLTSVMAEILLRPFALTLTGFLLYNLFRLPSLRSWNTPFGVF